IKVKDLIFISDPFSIVLLRATEPKYWNEYRNKTAQGIVKRVREPTRTLHWDYPEIVVYEIRKNWSYSQARI
ncbi:hypothetical protein NPM04_33580, partial [Bacillus cereus]|nr:hypothetical protein [Bacillus cereus]